VFPREPRLLRPANYPTGVPGRGSYVFTTPGGESLRVLHLMGRAFMPTIDCPFQVAKRNRTSQDAGLRDRGRYAC
jgi:calcineurin-like phosphoesterase